MTIACFQVPPIKSLFIKKIYLLLKKVLVFFQAKKNLCLKSLMGLWNADDDQLECLVMTVI
jgi:hypothetical protein